MSMIIAILIGIGLSASAGFRVFIPPLITSIAAKASWITLATQFEWVGSTPALIAFSIAAILEISSYYIPVIDNAMKAIATPASIVSGILLTASLVWDVDPLLKWSVSVLGGGGIATITHLMTLFIRGTSTIVTGGIGNILVSILEGISAIALSILSLLFPFAVIIAIVVILWMFFKTIRSLKRRRKVIASE